MQPHHTRSIPGNRFLLPSTERGGEWLNLGRLLSAPCFMLPGHAQLTVVAGGEGGAGLG